MDESAVQKPDCQLLQSPKLQPKDDRHNSKLNNSLSTNNVDLLKVPKRKLSVFCRSFDVIEARDQENTLEFRRTSSNPSVAVGSNDMQDEGSRSRDDSRETSPCRKGFVNSCRSLIENGKFVNSENDCLGERPSNPRCFPSRRSPVMEPKLPRAGDNVVDNCSTINETSTEKQPKLENGGLKTVDKNVANSSTEVDRLPSASKSTSSSESIENYGMEKDLGFGQSQQAAAASDDLVKIKDTACPPTFVDASSAGRRKYIAVGAEMSNHEDSSTGSESEDEAIEENGRVERIEETRNDRSRPPSSFSIAELPGEPDSIRITDGEKTEDLVQTNREKRQRFFAARRSLSEGDCKRYHRAKRHCGCSKQEGQVNEEDQFRAFPSFADCRLQNMGFANFDETSDLCRDNLVSSESELERKYIAFSIGLGTDRITLQRRVTMSRRQRDLSEQNFEHEIQKLQEEIKDLSRYSLHTDGESMERVERVRHRLDVVKTCACKISSAAETLGAVLQEQRISPEIFVADRYLQILRTRCDNLSTEIAEIKRILLMHNIVIEEDSGEIYDVPLQPSRYRNGSSWSNRTMMARRRASIATISRPLTSQDVTKIFLITTMGAAAAYTTQRNTENVSSLLSLNVQDCPRQRNSSVSGRVTIRKSSWCSEMMWENEKQARKDSSNSVVELRDISEQTESRRNSREENNNLLRHDQIDNIDTINHESVDNINDEDWPSSGSTCLLESRIVEKQLVPCIRTAEPLRITTNFQTWRPGIWYMLFFLLGFYVNYITMSVVESKANVS